MADVTERQWGGLTTDSYSYSMVTVTGPANEQTNGPVSISSVSDYSVTDSGTTNYESTSSTNLRTYDDDGAGGFEAARITSDNSASGSFAWTSDFSGDTASTLTYTPRDVDDDGTIDEDEGDYTVSLSASDEYEDSQSGNESYAVSYSSNILVRTARSDGGMDVVLTASQLSDEGTNAFTVSANGTTTFGLIDAFDSSEPGDPSGDGTTPGGSSSESYVETVESGTSNYSQSQSIVTRVEGGTPDAGSVPAGGEAVLHSSDAFSSGQSGTRSFTITTSVEKLESSDGNSELETTVTSDIQDAGDYSTRVSSSQTIINAAPTGEPDPDAAGDTTRTYSSSFSTADHGTFDDHRLETEQVTLTVTPGTEDTDGDGQIDPIVTTDYGFGWDNLSNLTGNNRSESTVTEVVISNEDLPDPEGDPVTGRYFAQTTTSSNSQSATFTTRIDSSGTTGQVNGGAVATTDHTIIDDTRSYSYEISSSATFIDIAGDLTRQDEHRLSSSTNTFSADGSGTTISHTNSDSVTADGTVVSSTLFEWIDNSDTSSYDIFSTGEESTARTSGSGASGLQTTFLLDSGGTTTNDTYFERDVTTDGDGNWIGSGYETQVSTDTESYLMTVTSRMHESGDGNTFDVAMSMVTGAPGDQAGTVRTVDVRWDNVYDADGVNRTETGTRGVERSGRTVTTVDGAGAFPNGTYTLSTTTTQTFNNTDTHIKNLDGSTSHEFDHSNGSVIDTEHLFSINDPAGYSMTHNAVNHTESEDHVYGDDEFKTVVSEHEATTASGTGQTVLVNGVPVSTSTNSYRYESWRISYTEAVDATLMTTRDLSRFARYKQSADKTQSSDGTVTESADLSDQSLDQDTGQITDNYTNYFGDGAFGVFDTEGSGEGGSGEGGGDPPPSGDPPPEGPGYTEMSGSSTYDWQSVNFNDLTETLTFPDTAGYYDGALNQASSYLSSNPPAVDPFTITVWVDDDGDLCQHADPASAGCHEETMTVSQYLAKIEEMMDAAISASAGAGTPPAVSPGNGAWSDSLVNPGSYSFFTDQFQTTPYTGSGGNAAQMQQLSGVGNDPRDNPRTTQSTGTGAYWDIDGIAWELSPKDLERWRTLDARDPRASFLVTFLPFWDEYNSLEAKIRRDARQYRLQQRYYRDDTLGPQAYDQQWNDNNREMIASDIDRMMRISDGVDAVLPGAYVVKKGGKLLLKQGLRRHGAENVRELTVKLWKDEIGSIGDVDGYRRLSLEAPTNILSKGERLKIFNQRLLDAPATKNAEEAFELLGKTMDDVEDAFSGVARVDNPGLKYDGRMYPPRPDFTTRLPGGGLEAITKGNIIRIDPNGAIRIYARNADGSLGKLLLEKLGGG